MALQWLPAVDMFNQYLSKYTENVEKQRKMLAAQHLSDKYSQKILTTTNEEELGQTTIGMMNESMAFGVPEVMNAITPMVNIKQQMIKSYDEKKNADEIYKMYMENAGDNKFYYNSKIQTLGDIGKQITESISNPITRAKVLEQIAKDNKVSNVQNIAFDDKMQKFSVQTQQIANGQVIETLNSQPVSYNEKENVWKYDDDTIVPIDLQSKLSEIAAKGRQNKEEMSLKWANLNRLSAGGSGGGGGRQWQKNRIQIKNENGEIEEVDAEVSLFSYNQRANNSLGYIPRQKIGTIIKVRGGDILLAIQNDSNVYEPKPRDYFVNVDNSINGYSKDPYAIEVVKRIVGEMGEYDKDIQDKIYDGATPEAIGSIKGYMNRNNKKIEKLKREYPEFKKLYDDFMSITAPNSSSYTNFYAPDYKKGEEIMGSGLTREQSRQNYVEEKPPFGW